MLKGQRSHIGISSYDREVVTNKYGKGFLRQSKIAQNNSLSCN